MEIKGLEMVKIGQYNFLLHKHYLIYYQNGKVKIGGKSVLLLMVKVKEFLIQSKKH